MATFIDPLTSFSADEEDLVPTGNFQDISSLENILNEDESDSELGNVSQRDHDVDSLLSPSLGSIASSILADIHLRDDTDSFLENKDLQIRIDNPEKHVSTMETYITFRITTRTTRPQFDKSEYTVRRRYNDFVWLRQKFLDTHPTHLIPALPEKHSLRGQLDRYDREFVVQRMTLLNKFLSRVSGHTTLSYDPSLMVFLTAESVEWTCHKKTGSSILGRVSMGFQNMASSYMVRERPQEFRDYNEYAERLAGLLASLDRVSTRIHRERTEYAFELEEFYPVFTLWASSEPELAPTLEALAKAVESCACANKELNGKYTLTWGLPLKEYKLYVEAVKEALRRRDAFQIEHELTVDELTRKRKELEELGRSEAPGLSLGSLFGKSKEEVLAEKSARLDATLKDLVTQAGVTGDRIEVANSDLRADMDRWIKGKNSDVGCLLRNMADSQVQLHQACLSSWEDALTAIREQAL